MITARTGKGQTESTLLSRSVSGARLIPGLAGTGAVKFSFDSTFMGIQEHDNDAYPGQRIPHGEPP